MYKYIFDTFSLKILTSFINIIGLACLSISLSHAVSPPNNIIENNSHLRGEWKFPEDIEHLPHFGDDGEMKIDIYLKGLGSIDIQMETKLEIIGDTAGFFVDIDIFNFLFENSWNSMELTLGTGVGTSFVASNQNDGLHFVVNSRTKDENNIFSSPFTENNEGERLETITFSDGTLPPRIDAMDSGNSLTAFINAPDIIDSETNGSSIFTLRVTGKVDVPPIPFISINDVRNSVTSDHPLLKIAFDSSGFKTEADWWLVALVSDSASSNGWYHFDLNTANFAFAGNSINDLRVTYQGPLFSIKRREIPTVNQQNLESGTYTYYLAVDMNKDGQLDFSDLLFDSVQVTIPQR